MSAEETSAVSRRPWPTALHVVPPRQTPPASRTTVTVGAPGQQLTASAAAAPPAAKEEVEGVLEPFKPIMQATIGLVSFGAIAQAGWNLSHALSKFAHLPWPLAIGFPLGIELGAVTFALQDIWDRRKTGRVNPEYRAATYALLVVSSVINGAVGYALYKTAGLVEVIPPLIIGAMIHMHGNRATAAYHSQAITRPAWRAAHLKKAKNESVLGVLPMLVGKDSVGQASIKLIETRMKSGTLDPDEALFFAGWEDRFNRGLSKAQLQHLELVAATVWGHSYRGSPTASPVRVTASPMRLAGTPPNPAAGPRRALAASAPIDPAATPPPNPADPAARPRRNPLDPAAATPPRRAATTPPTPPNRPAAARQATPPELAAIAAAARADKPAAGETFLREALAARGLTAPRAQLRAALKQTPPPSTSTDSTTGNGTGSGRVDS